jgi:hypothetical protein
MESTTQSMSFWQFKSSHWQDSQGHTGYNKALSSSSLALLSPLDDHLIPACSRTPDIPLPPPPTTAVPGWLKAAAAAAADGAELAACRMPAVEIPNELLVCCTTVAVSSGVRYIMGRRPLQSRNTHENLTDYTMLRRETVWFRCHSTAGHTQQCLKYALSMPPCLQFTVHWTAA